MNVVRIFFPILTLVLTVSAAQAALPSFDGTWLSNCYDEKGLHFQDTLTVKGHDASDLVRGFSDASCKTLSFAAEGKETIQEGKESEFAKGASEIDGTVSSLSLAYYDANVVDYLNKSSFCGLNNWKVGVMNDITGRKCAGVDMPKAGDRSYDILQVLGTTMRIGKRTTQYDGTTPEKRPRELDMAKAYIKQ
jgi:hypothetical protein